MGSGALLIADDLPRDSLELSSKHYPSILDCRWLPHVSKPENWTTFKRAL